MPVRPRRQPEGVVTITCDLIANLDTIRVTAVNACGVPVPGEHAFVTECVGSLAMNNVLDTQDDIIYRAANGTLCGVKRGCPTLLGYDVEINFFQVSPQLVDVLTGQPIVLDSGGVPVGFDSCGVNCQTGFALEFWAELIGQNCTGGTPKFLYGVLPWITNAYLNDLEIGAEQVAFQLLGSTRAGGGWGVGPYNVVPGVGDVPSPMLTPLGATCHRRMQTTTIAPPTPDPECDYTTVPTPAP